MRQLKPRSSEQHLRIFKSFSHKGKPGHKEPDRQIHGQVYCNCGQHAPVRADPQLFPPYLVVQVALRLTGPAPTAVTAQLQAPPAMSVLRLARMLTLRVAGACRPDRQTSAERSATGAGAHSFRRRCVRCAVSSLPGKTNVLLFDGGTWRTRSHHAFAWWRP